MAKRMGYEEVCPAMAELKEIDYRDLLLRMIYLLTLCENSGDVWDVIVGVLRRTGLDIEWEDGEEFDC